MSADFKTTVVGLLTTVLRALNGPAAGQSSGAATVAADLTADHVSALGAILQFLPVNDLLSIAQGRATWDTAIDLAERAADIVRAAFPPAAVTAEEVKLGLEALGFLLDLAGVGSAPFKIEPGQNPIRGGWSGARGHV